MDRSYEEAKTKRITQQIYFRAQLAAFDRVKDYWETYGYDSDVFQQHLYRMVEEAQVKLDMVTDAKTN